MHKLKKSIIYPLPNRFVPDRFLDNGKFVHDPQVCNFSVGLRNCVGRQLAQTQYFQTAAQLVNRFTISAECVDLNPRGRVTQAS